MELLLWLIAAASTGGAISYLVLKKKTLDSAEEEMRLRQCLEEVEKMQKIIEELGEQMKLD